MPELILDRSKCLGNIEKMSKIALQHQLSFRPHCKTHQSAEIAGWFREFGVSKITVSSFSMAAYFADHGWEDILVAFPFHPQNIRMLGQIPGTCRISILLDHPDIHPFLQQVDRKVDFYLDVDTGYGRTGVRSEESTVMEEIIQTAHNNQKLNFAGFYCHAGHSYKTRTTHEREEIHQKARRDLQALKEHFREYAPKVLYGDTPNCSTRTDFRGIDEITPGNFVFYDLVQRSLGSCTTEEIAVAVSCPVVSRYPKERRLLIHGGAVHFSKEILILQEKEIFGEAVRITDTGWDRLESPCYLSGISQEHGVLEHCGALFEQLNSGDNLHILPVHSCLTAHLMRYYRTLEGQVITTMNS
jgi:D-serine deaminase-like pyridoxal phosphate-dependent protein